MLRKPDGTPPDLPRRADLLVYEVRRSGGAGECAGRRHSVVFLLWYTGGGAAAPQDDRPFDQKLSRPSLLSSLAQVFDSGCIGEGVLHLVTAARAKLLAADAAMVPIAARVFCQPIQVR